MAKALFKGGAGSGGAGVFPFVEPGAEVGVTFLGRG
jgi:hypothetical protein